jgi:hypothetical protein
MYTFKLRKGRIKMKKGLIFMAMLAGVLAFGFSQTAFTVRNAATWIEAVNGVRNGGDDQEYVITVTGTVTIPASQESTFGPVTGIAVTITGGGTLTTSSNGCLLIIGAGQTVVAGEVILRGRDNNNAPVVAILREGIFRMEGKASVTGNKTGANGGGAYNNGTFTMQDSATVSGNTSSGRDGGGGVYNQGTFTMQGSATVSGNTASSGGGVYNKGKFTIRDSASLSGNTTSGGWRNCGGGVYNDDGPFTMEGGAISSNTASEGGGIYIAGGTFTMQDGAISGNTANEGGGGVDFEYGTFIMEGGTISGNKAASYGGGVYGSSGMLGRTGTFTMKGGAISGNTASEGGGVYNKGAFTMEGGTISGHTSSFIGGGIYIARGTFTMEGGAVSGNKAVYYGGGVYVAEDNVYNRVTFTKIGGTFYGYDAEQNLKNTVVSRLGHAVYQIGDNNWRNATAGPTMNSDSYGFWMNDGDNDGDTVATFPSDFAGIRKRSNFNNRLTVTENIMKSSSSNSLWILQSVSGDRYTLKRSDTANTMTLTIKLGGFTRGFMGGDGSYGLVISGDSGSGENNWNGTWQ